MLGVFTIILIVAWVVVPIIQDLCGYKQKDMDVYEQYVKLQRIKREQKIIR